MFSTQTVTERNTCANTQNLYTRNLEQALLQVVAVCWLASNGIEIGVAVFAIDFEDHSRFFHFV